MAVHVRYNSLYISLPSSAKLESEMTKERVLGHVQTPYFTWAESNANEQNPLFSLICIRFGSCEVRRLNLA